MGLLAKYKKWKESLNKELGLNDLYTMTKYHRILSDDEVKELMFRDINDQIKAKVTRGNYALILDLIDDYEKYQNEIISHYKELGLTAQIIDVELGDSKSIIKYLLITWRK